MGVISRNFSGLSCHIAHFHLDEGDKKRHRGRCKYYYATTKYCKCLCIKCIGSSHCEYYCEKFKRVSNK